MFNNCHKINICLHNVSICLLLQYSKQSDIMKLGIAKIKANYAEQKNKKNIPRKLFKLLL